MGPTLALEELVRYAKFGDSFLIKLESGEEIVGSLTAFAADHRIDVGSVTGIGSAHEVELGYYDRPARQYVRRRVPDETEIVSLSGNLAIQEGRAVPHLHIALGTPDFQLLAGHLFAGLVGGTCELIVRPLPGFLQRLYDPVTGLYLLDL